MKNTILTFIIWFIIFTGVLSLTISACTTKRSNSNDENLKSLKFLDSFSMKGEKITVFEYNGCHYMVSTSESILHLQTCPNKKNHTNCP